MNIDEKRIQLDYSFLEDLKLFIYNYFNRKPYVNNIQLNEILRRLNTKKRISAGNIVEQGIGRMLNEDKSDAIIVDEQFFYIDGNGALKFKTEKMELITTILIHELMHSVSRKFSVDGNILRTGIRKVENVTDNIDISNSVAEIYAFFGGAKFFKKNTGLDEGITQMMAEKVSGNIVSPEIDSYKNLKKYAKILESTFGENVIFNSYVFGENDLEMACKQLTGSIQFWNSFNLILDNDFDIIHKSRDSRLSEHERQIWDWFTNNMQSHIIKYFTASIIIPKLRQCTKSEQIEYIKNILECVKDDSWFKNEIFSQIQTLNNKNYQELEKEKKDAFSTIKSYTGFMKSSMKCLYSYEYADSLIKVRNNGVYLLSDKEGSKEYLVPHNTPFEEKILALKFYLLRKEKIYNEKKFMYPSLSKKDLALETYDEISNIELKIISDAFKTRKITFNSGQNIMARKLLLSEIKVLLGYNGYEVLNSLSECEKSDTIYLNIRKLKEDSVKSSSIFDLFPNYNKNNVVRVQN